MSSELREWCGDPLGHEPHRSIGRRPGENLLCLGVPYDEVLANYAEERDRKQQDIMTLDRLITERAEAFHDARRALL